MNGIFIKLGKEIPSFEQIKSFFKLYPWISVSSTSSNNFMIVNSFLSEGINKEHFENAELLIILQGFIFINNRFITKADDLLEFFYSDEKKFIKQIKTGVFNIVFFDKQKQKIKIINDRFGLLPLYYYVSKNELFISSKITPIYKFTQNNLKINNDAIKDLLTFGYIVGNETFFEDIKLFQYASVFKINIKTLDWDVKNYWKPVFNYSDRNKKFLTDKKYSTLKESVDRLSFLTENKKICFLSGGLDSRTIYALHKPPIDAATSGFKNSNEKKFAELVTFIGNKGNHEKFEFSEEIMRKYFLDSVKITEGMHNITTSFIPYFAQNIKEKEYKLRYDGYLGDVLFGGTYISKYQLHFKDVLHDIFIGMNQTILNKKNIQILKRKLLEDILINVDENQTFDVKKHIKKRFDHLIDLSLKEFPDLKYTEDLCDMLHIYFGRGRKYIKFGQIQHQCFYDVVSPFFDYDVFDVYLQIPPKLRSWYKIYIELYKKYFKKYNTIPCTSLSGLKPTVPNFYYRLYGYIDAGLTSKGLKKNFSYLKIDEWLSEGSVWRENLIEYAKYLNKNFKEINLDINNISKNQLIKAASIGAYLKILSKI